MTKSPTLTHFTLRQWKQLGLSVAMVASMAACSSTSDDNQTPYLTLDRACIEQGMEMHRYAEASGENRKYRVAANGLADCLEVQVLSMLAPEQDQEAMHLLAISTLDFLKAGEVQQAENMMQRFTQAYPDQDLYFADYSSFLDTYTAIVKGARMTASELVALNISHGLRDEIERQQYWLTH